MHPFLLIKFFHFPNKVSESTFPWQLTGSSNVINTCDTPIMCSIVNGTMQTESIESKPKCSLIDLIGEWGPWQSRTVVLIFLCKIPAAWFMACIIFTAPFAQYGEFACQQPNTGLTPANHTEWINIAHPTTEDGQFDFCRVYKNRTEALVEWQQQQPMSQPTIVPIDYRTSDTENCNAFEHNSIFNSLVTQFDLVCSRTVLIAVTQFWHLVCFALWYYYFDRTRFNLLNSS